MSAYARYIRRRALATADRPAQRSPDASEEARDQPHPSGPASGKRLLEISDSDAAKLLAVLKLLG
ncbi:hypothetical protein ACM76R_14260 [Pseudomonas aeruginosa]|uniref:hypothetical protein n=1 Tax=Pseudomonas aeruginosa TaxID=287 RepID=UPI00070BCC58|nr:hypothetical protein [Pseudomonas aeruginosa]MCV0075855.1 hypothetical protein [Pseudomonas aeruginosa]MCV0199921.1 hypothetical protein [Pseudomonas aeruginosa]MEC6484410.1 hypothetical protein [Pseudomonas aeruginosa]NPT01279.1 hypothetical protein [Pseudomonas aeruginosa]QKE96169.1 hypothetical protein HPT10_11315 [Pseudomonas aeruginosa]